MIEKMNEKREISPLEIPESIRNKCPEAQKDYKMAILQQKKKMFRKRLPIILTASIIVIVIIVILFSLF